MHTPTFSSISLAGLISIAGLGAHAQTKPAAAPTAPALAPAAPPEINETSYDIIEIGPIAGKSGAKATQLKYNTKHYEDPKAIADEASELMARVLPATEADHNKFAIINAVKPEEPKGVKAIFERKASGEWTLKGAPETPKLAEQLAAAYAKFDAAAKAKDSAAIAALETPDFGHYLADGTARTSDGDAQHAALSMKSVATYGTKIIAFFVRNDQVFVVQDREWTGDYLPNKMGAVRKAKENTHSVDVWLLAGDQLKLMRSKELDEKMVKL